MEHTIHIQYSFSMQLQMSLVEITSWSMPSCKLNDMFRPHRAIVRYI
jgi:hypothetical protein